MRRYALLVPAILLLVRPASASKLTVRGFVTAVHSPNSFAIDDYKVTCDPGLIFEAARDASKAAAAVSVPPFKHEDIRVGTELEVEGDYDKSSSELKATSVRVFLFDTIDVDRIALMENRIHLEKTASGAWQGVFLADGQRVSVSDKTVVTIKQSLRKLDADKPKKTSAAKPPTPPDSLDGLRLDSFVHYQGTDSQADGTVLATRVEFENGGAEPGAVDLMQKYAPKVREPNYSAPKPGQLKLGPKKFILVPDREAQDYVSRIGNSLIPERQKSLADGDPSKIPFRFYLVDDNTPDANGYPSGAVVVNSGLFAALDNEAELAFVLAHEMAAVAEEIWWRDLDYHKGTTRALSAVQIGSIGLDALGPAGMGAGWAVRGVTGLEENSVLHDQYWLSLENQAEPSRTGLDTGSGL